MSAVRIGRQAAKVRIELLDVDADIEFVRFDLAPDAARRIARRLNEQAGAAERHAEKWPALTLVHSSRRRR